MRVSRGFAVLSLTTAAVLGLSACSSDDAAKPDRAVESGTTAEEVVEEQGDFDLTAEDFVERVSAAMKAQETLTIEMTTTAAGVTSEAVGQVRYVGDTQEMAMTMSAGAGAEAGMATDIEMRVVGGIVYMTMGELTGGKFLQIDPNDPSDPLASSFAGMSGQLDPTSALTELDGAITSLEKAGEPEERGGALAQPYALTVDTAALETTNLDGSAASLPAQIVYTYWVDADDLMRGMSVDVAESTVEMTFTKWGEPVEIAAPTADQITEMPSF
ncbi:LppX_LprAFG lipoprotein [Cellulomonas triticagri]|uniref:LppX_LprAFG lipoprotein n=1 Tax=Cellulomonas triticagri TaxID=2483352 RepID=A0A3M2JG11_9CELL|nr:LppX_LprAFG lipoprotein [Cellulomonas triticagri]RMI12469.1 LppX_LprAFG lipoprotein [Cellulomonas triticagri]